MRLTNYIRDAFIRAVMNDVPSIDYDTQIRELAMKKCVERLPKKVREAWKDKETRPFVAVGHMAFGHKAMADIPGVDGWSFIGEQPAMEWFADIHALIELEGKQKEQRSVLEDKVRAVAYACSTREALLKQLPEFEKYLPAEAAKSTSLPAVANLVTDLLKAGWPDGGKKKVAESVAA